MVTLRKKLTIFVLLGALVLPGSGHAFPKYNFEDLLLISFAGGIFVVGRTVRNLYKFGVKVKKAVIKRGIPSPEEAEKQLLSMKRTFLEVFEEATGENYISLLADKTKIPAFEGKAKEIYDTFEAACAKLSAKDYKKIRKLRKKYLKDLDKHFEDEKVWSIRYVVEKQLSLEAIYWANWYLGKNRSFHEMAEEFVRFTAELKYKMKKASTSFFRKARRSHENPGEDAEFIEDAILGFIVFAAVLVIPILPVYITIKFGVKLIDAVKGKELPSPEEAEKQLLSMKRTFLEVFEGATGENYIALLVDKTKIPAFEGEAKAIYGTFEAARAKLSAKDYKKTRKLRKKYLKDLDRHFEDEKVWSIRYVVEKQLSLEAMYWSNWYLGKNKSFHETAEKLVRFTAMLKDKMEKASAP